MISVPELYIHYTSHPCSICGAQIIDSDRERGPEFCPDHPVGRKHAWRSEGRIFSAGKRKKFIAKGVERIGLFAAVVDEYEEIEEDIWRVQLLEYWHDHETGALMGEHIGSRPL